MRSTRAAAAVARLNERSGDLHYVMTKTGNDLFYLSLQKEDGSEEKVTETLDQDEFVRQVKLMGPQEVRRMTKNDIAFEKQLVKKPVAE